jgi:TonB family protein
MQSAMDWVEGQRAESGWSMRSLLVLSLVGHLCLMLGLMLTPGPAPLRIPQALTVELVAAIPVAPKPPAPTPAPAPTPTPTPTPAPAPTPAPPPPKPKVKILPKQAPSVQLKPKPKPKPEPALRRRPRPKELAYEDALAQLRGELGEPPAAMDSPEPAESPAPPAAADSPSAQSSLGVKVDPVLLAWHQAVKRHIRAVWINPQEFRNRGLAAELVIDVAIDGRVLGRPKLVASSGNPFYDDNAVRALTRVSPLPPPPKAGLRTIVFTSEE